MSKSKQGSFVWFECVSRDLTKAQGFYGEVFGWKVEPFSMGPTSYPMIKAGEAMLGGFVTLEPTDSRPPHWLSYLAVDDVDASARAVVKAGGKLLAPAFEVPTVGRMAAVADPQGAAFMLFTSADAGEAPQATGPGSFHWNELHARDAAAAADFYAEVFGYVARAMPMPDGSSYHLLEQGGVPLCGITTAAAKTPPMWLPYVTVADCDATARRAEKLGANRVVAPTDIPEVGRFAVHLDPQGAAIAMIKPAPRS